MSTLGKISVHVESDSASFGYQIPVDIRDRNLRIVKGGTTDRLFEVKPGVYQVSAVMEDGREHSQLVRVTKGETANVEIRVPQKKAETDPVSKVRRTTRPRYEAPRFTQKVDTIDDVETASVAAEFEVRLVDVQGANTVRETRTLWIFECQADVDQVPTATVRIGDTLSEISLPTSPGGAPTPNLCAVRVEDSTTGPSATAWISPERSLANALQNMLASGKVLHAAHMADQATELLHDKYSDPTGATLGALILHKVGRLNRLQSWVENLVSDFGWIPDAKVLLAVMLFDDRSDLQGALNLATEASQQRMLFTECYSILLDLLRRWPKKYEWELRVPSLMALTERSAYIDWK